MELNTVAIAQLQTLLFSETEKQPLIIFDIETTGLNVCQDRICSLAYLKISETEHSFAYQLINPGRHIPPEATTIHGISDADVYDKPEFPRFAKALQAAFTGCRIVGFNSNFYDVPLLAEEFNRCGIQFPDNNAVLIDSCNIERFLRPHTLINSYKIYRGIDYSSEAHNALNDVFATMEVLAGQANIYDQQFSNADQNKNKQTCDKLSEASNSKCNAADMIGNLVYNEAGEVCYNFGKNKGRPVLNDRGYANWMLANDFSIMTKRVLRELLAL